MTETTHSQEKKELKAQNAKYQLELESIKVDLKNTREELDKERRDGDRERGILQQRVTDLKALLSEKENLSNRLRLAKQYESVQESWIIYVHLYVSLFCTFECALCFLR